MSANNILVVDDEIGIRELLSEILADEGYTVRLAENAAAARHHRREGRPDLVLLDIWMPDTDGISLLKEWAASGQLTMPVVMMSGHGTIESAIEATRIGAIDFLEKPISLPKLIATVSKALAGGRAWQHRGLSFAHLGRARVIVELKQRLDQVARRGRAGGRREDAVVREEAELVGHLAQVLLLHVEGQKRALEAREHDGLQVLEGEAEVRVTEVKLFAHRRVGHEAVVGVDRDAEPERFVELQRVAREIAHRQTSVALNSA